MIYINEENSILLYNVTLPTMITVLSILLQSLGGTLAVNNC